MQTSNAITWPVAPLPPVVPEGGQASTATSSTSWPHPTASGPVEASHERVLGERANMDWEMDRQVLMERSERRAWRVAQASLVAVVLSLGAVFAQGALRQVVPLPVVVDRTTGEVTVQQRLSVETVPLNEALDKHHVARFVRARQAYVWNFLQQDYNLVGRMSTPDVFDPYGKQFDGKEGLDQKWKATQEHRIHIVNVRLTQAARPGQSGDAVVTYDKEIVFHDHSQPDQTSRHMASVRFEYRPSVLLKEGDRLDNPLGFVVTAYRSDPEINRPHRTGNASAAPSNYSDAEQGALK